MSEYSLALGSVLAGKYKVLRVLGAGGMGAVYLAENLDIGRQVAIKVLHAQIGQDAGTRQRFRQEARTSAVINHPGIVDILDMGETSAGEAFIVMERLEGQTLGARLKQRGRLSVDEAITIITEALDAIGAAHAKGIVHRDLKPDNLFLVWHPRWCVKILDFGISRFLNADDVRLTASNTLMGSVLYMPPEQARDAKYAGPPADLYALGATLYHVLAGKPPFMGDSYTEVLTRVIGDPPVPLEQHRADVPEAVSALVAELLAKDPAARPPSAAAVRERLLAFLPAPVPPEPPPPAIDALLDTAQPASPLAETADASMPPALPVSIKIPKGAATSSIVGEVERLETAAKPPGPRILRRLMLLVVSVVALLVVAIVVKKRSHRVVTVHIPHDAFDVPDVQQAAVAIDAGAVIDATELPDARLPDRGRPDAGIRRRPDAGMSTISADAATPKPDAKESGHLPLSPLPQ